MIYKNKQSTFSMSSTWTCNFYVANGRLEWYITATPTTAIKAVSFPIALPSDAVVSRAWLSMGVGSPASGTAVLQVNGINAKTGTVELEGITAGSTVFNAAFTFRANGVVHQDTQTHSGSMTITDPTLHVEYTSGDGTDDGEDDENEVTIITGGLDSGVHLPRLLDATFHEVSRLTPDSLKLAIKLHPLSTAVLKLPPGESSVKVRDFLELFSPHGSAGVFRATEVESAYGYRSGQTVYLEHAIGTLADSLAIGTQAMSAPVATVIATLLENQNICHWVLGDCDVPADYELIYEYSYDNLLQAIIKLTNMLPPEYAWEFDTTHHPFVMHLRKMPDDDSCECRLNRNLTTVHLNIDSSDLCTRVYAFGAGESTDRVTLTNLIGTQYMDSENASVWGYVSRTFTSEDIFDALTLRDVAQRYLDRHDTPTVSVRLDAMDLSEATGEAFDRFRLGRVCRLPLPDYGVTMRERVVETTWPDVYGDPENIEVILANRIRNASDEIAELMREATNSKLLGGTVESIEESSRAGGITPGSPFVQSFEITGYGNVLNVRTSYTCETAEGTKVTCLVSVDGTDLDASDTETGVVDITRYLSADENGVPLVGEHRVRLQPRTINTMTSTIDNTITIKQIEKR